MQVEKKPSSGQLGSIDTKRAKVEPTPKKEDIGSGIKQKTSEILDPLPSPLQLRFVGFCGVDESFADPDLKHHDWPSFIEWGVLFREEKEGTQRFPKRDWIEKFVVGKPHLAAHLCSSRCEALLNGNFTFVRELHEKLGFGRFQINATMANGVNSATLGKAQVENIAKIARELTNAEFIIQRNDETKPLWEGMEELGEQSPRNVSYLFDASVGRGVVVDDFPPPKYEWARYGYAGGIKPENVQHVVRKVAAKVPPGVQVWIDMESGIREMDDKFSVERAWRVCEALDELHVGSILAFKN
jgi:hypothetical protein